MPTVKILCCIFLWLHIVSLRCNVAGTDDYVQNVNADFSADVDVAVDGDSGEYEEAEIVEPKEAETPTDEDDFVYGDTLMPSPLAKIETMIIEPRNITSIVHGVPNRFLINFENLGRSSVYNFETLEVSLRYPQDFSYVLQNFSVGKYFQKIQPGEEMNFEYSFIVSDAFATRPVGFVMVAYYTDDKLRSFANELINKTIIINEPENGFDVELFFLYVFFAALIILACVAIHQGVSYLLKKSRKGSKRKAQATEQNFVDGLATKEQVNFEWIPKNNLEVLAKRSPNTTGKSSVKKRRREKNPHDDIVNEDMPVEENHRLTD